MMSLIVLLLVGLVMIGSGGLNNSKNRDRYSRPRPYFSRRRAYPLHPQEPDYWEYYPYEDMEYSPRRGQNLGMGCFMMLIMLAGILLAVATRGGG